MERLPRGTLTATTSNSARAVAVALFDAIIDRLRWPALQIHDLSIATADWKPDRWLREFPNDTLVDSDGRAIWDA